MFLLKPVKWIVKKMLKGNEEDIVVYLNSKIDLPKLDEKEEAKLIKKIFDTIIDIVDAFI